MTLWPFQHVTCFSLPYERRFVAQRCSPAYCLYVLCWLALVLVPVFVTFSTDSVWVKESSYHEQPRVSFAHDLMVVLSGDARNEAVGWGTRADLDPLLPERVRVPILRSSSVDKNFDGVPDTWRLSLDLPTGNISEGYRHLMLLAVYNFELREKVRERIGALAALDLASPFPATGVSVQGKWRLQQDLPLPVTHDVRDVYAENPLAVDYRSSWATRHQPIRVAALLERYAERNETVYLEQVLPPVWDYAPRDSFRLELRIDVAPQTVKFVPGAPEVLKLAWMQLLALGVPTWLALHVARTFLYDRQVVETYVVQQLPAKEAM